ncbi:MAG: hypothetical protein QNJ19_10350 [Woeseiaceae bacterium]|nr:hypothetical protein [Woeseiaceae bacterium]
MQLSGKSDDEILAVADPIMDRLMEGSNRIDHAMHVSDFTERLRSIVSEAGLERMCQDFQSRCGLFSRRELVAIFRRRDSVAVVWRQYATETDDEFVADLVLVEKDGRFLVDHALIY